MKKHIIDEVEVNFRKAQNVSDKDALLVMISQSKTAYMAGDHCSAKEAFALIRQRCS